MAATGDSGRRTTDLVRRLGWLVGMPLAALRYVRTTRHHLVEGPWTEPPAIDAADTPRTARGVRQHFELRIRSAEIPAEKVLSVIAAHPNLVVPAEVLRWEVPGDAGYRLATGDHLLLRMAGPWNGPLTVVARDPRRLAFETRPGHPLRGRVDLRLEDVADGLRAEIRLWQRADSRVLALVHDRLGLTMRMQAYTWVGLLERIRRLSGGTADGPVVVRTQREPRSRLHPERWAPRRRRARSSS